MEKTSTRLFHGTSIERFELIVRSGRLKPPVHLTSCSERAQDYARGAAKRDGGDWIVLVIDADDEGLASPQANGETHSRLPVTIGCIRAQKKGVSKADLEPA